jgi:hypothetical protein
VNWASVAFGIVVVIGITNWWLVRSPSRSPRVLPIYENQSYPMFVRNGIGPSPIAAPAAVIFAFGGLVPSPTRWWLFVAVVILVEVTLVLCYRVPAPLLARWLLADIDAGRVEVARPDRGDWVLFWTFILIFTAAEVTVPVAVLTGLLH